MLKSIIVILLLITCIPTMINAVHYYNVDKEVPIYIDSSKLVVKFANLSTPHDLTSILAGITRFESILDDEHVFDNFLSVSLTSTADYDLLLDSLRGLSEIELVEPYYVDWLDSAKLVGSTIYLQFHIGVSDEEIDSLLAIYGGEPIYPFAPSETIYAIKNTPTTGIGTLELANIYNNLSETRYAHPEFSIRVTLHGYNLYDYYSSNQDHIKKVIGQFNNKSVWDFYGLTKTIRVAVVDDGVTAHDDLPASRVLSTLDWDYYERDPGAQPGIDETHGMSVAGIIAASHTTDQFAGQQTSSGIISMAPNVEILSMKIASDDGDMGRSGVSTWGIRGALQKGVDVINCSWGWGRKPDLDYEPGVAALDLILDSAFALGVPVFFSSGNGYRDTVGYPAIHPKTFAVGASTLSDYRWDYSQYGPGLDLVAPSGSHFVDSAVWTLDQMGNLGYNPNNNDFGVVWDCGQPNDVDYNCKFGGTSAAAPIVSGTAALILSFDDTLGVEAVYDILRNSAVKEVGGGTITPPDLEYGYGRVDAFRAILSLARGDMDANGKINLADITRLVDQVYLGGPGGFPDVRLGNCDCDSEGNINLADINLLVDHVYYSKDPLPLPCFVY